MPELPKRKKQTYVRIKIAAIQYNGQVIRNNGLSVILNMRRTKKRENKRTRKLVAGWRTKETFPKCRRSVMMNTHINITRGGMKLMKLHRTN